MQMKFRIIPPLDEKTSQIIDVSFMIKHARMEV